MIRRNPYLREAPVDGYFDLESVINGRPVDLQQRILSGELTPNVMRTASASWKLVEEGTMLGGFPTSPWFSAGGPSLYGGAIAWLAEAAMGNAVYSASSPVRSSPRST
jgi:acyl-coenzyme A thioesterase PaaI-like protein